MKLNTLVRIGHSLTAVVMCFALVTSAWAETPATLNAETGAPQLALDEPVFDFGSVAQGASVVHDFTVKNVGTAPLAINRIQATCGCTAAMPAKTKLAPGEATTVKVSFDTTGSQGYKVKTVRLYTDDSRQPSRELTLQGSVKADIEINPPRLDFGRIKQGVPVEQSVNILVEKDSNLEILDVSAKPEQIQLEVKDLLSGGQTGKKVIARLIDTVPIGIFRGKILIRTTSKHNPVSVIPVFARVDGHLQLSPADISFGLLSGPLTQPVALTADLTNTIDAPLQVLRVESDNPAVETAFEEIEQGKRYRVTVTLPTGTIGTLRSRVQIITSQAGEEGTLTLPVYGIVAKKGA